MKNKPKKNRNWKGGKYFFTTLYNICAAWRSAGKVIDILIIIDAGILFLT